MHSENETDQSKRGINACTQDLLLDLVPVAPPDVFVGEFRPSSEGEYLALVAAAFSEIGRLKRGWAVGFRAQILGSRFLS